MCMYIYKEGNLSTIVRNEREGRYTPCGMRYDQVMKGGMRGCLGDGRMDRVFAEAVKSSE